ncbi:MAG: tRNA (adenosine(37)-N6)-threonylcarbamoyltransferase complex dimerization subunit type 1 TsaB [Candidatus Marinimicrobia bacterium]|jgi:tRNA threonylcarbamoyl adenosine modification protein YeaZ|nr:tRNA (adenosine(37)-N6)-threonylcarbamoyltransferase complex dimerization subunit type 1 TsaB [Candidatus Neomarinimicrobiota bacterium]MDP6612114.1 tRNA (adenosine(37)-N6)-threonylcarbamoyltransferase complex dimerization subunit type 1 TsaB [Candidatus Neomarinimicrobiota bacterium]|tara:strand:+ start:9960 stop:10580 length:621 start_codon:yes stop_codon:yes gene_type:complete
MNVLAIETSTDWCGVALVQDGICSCKIEEQIPRKHAEQLPLFYETVKDQTNLDDIQLDGVAISIGPGSFTGLRVGLGFAKGLAFAKDLPIIPVPTLQIMASSGKAPSDNFTVLLYSHRDIVYFQKFSGLKPTTPEKASTWDSVEPNSAAIHYGCEKLLTNEAFQSVPPSAEMTGILAEKHFDDWVQDNAYDLVPNYISPFELGHKK